MSEGNREYAICPRCARTVALMKDGRLMKHGHRRTCHNRDMRGFLVTARYREIGMPCRGSWESPRNGHR